MVDGENKGGNAQKSQEEKRKQEEGEQRAFLRIGYSKPYSPLFLSLSIGLIFIIVFEEHWC